MPCEITVSSLNKIRDKHECLILESYPGATIDVPKLWLYYDFVTSSYVLVKRIYDGEKRRSFKHVIIDDMALNDFPEKIPEIFQEAIKKIEEGGCLVWQTDVVFDNTNCADKPHC